MIDREQHPAGWALLVLELEEAQEHLAALVRSMRDDKAYAEHDLRIDLGHVYAHLNRAWRRRLAADALSDDAWEKAREFPDDLDPIA